VETDAFSGRRRPGYLLPMFEPCTTPNPQPICKMADIPDIQLRGVSFSYGSIPVLENVNLSIGPREAICVVGPNGGGKTTLLKLILGLLRPERGEVRLFGGPPRQGRLRIGYMPQHLRYDPLFPVTAMDVVLMGRLGQPGPAGRLGFFRSADRKAAREALALVGMEDAARRPLATLSDGQRQRVLIARALCSGPDLLLLDEPTASVDTLAEARLFEILRELKRRMTVVIVSHDLGFVTSVVENVACVNRRVVIHPTVELSGEVISDIYGGDVRVACHDDVVNHD